MKQQAVWVWRAKAAREELPKLVAKAEEEKKQQAEVQEKARYWRQKVAFESAQLEQQRKVAEEVKAVKEEVKKLPKDLAEAYEAAWKERKDLEAALKMEEARAVEAEERKLAIAEANQIFGQLEELKFSQNDIEEIKQEVEDLYGSDTDISVIESDIENLREIRDGADFRTVLGESYKNIDNFKRYAEFRSKALKDK